MSVFGQSIDTEKENSNNIQLKSNLNKSDKSEDEFVQLGGEQNFNECESEIESIRSFSDEQQENILDLNDTKENQPLTSVTDIFSNQTAKVEQQKDSDIV